MGEEKKVWLSFVGTVNEKDAETKEDKMEFLTEGNLYKEDSTTCITYMETEVSGMKGTATTVKVEPHKISVIRLGSVNSIMEFEKGKRHISQLSTPYGSIDLGVHTLGINVNYNAAEDPVEVNVHYALELNGVTNSENTLKIEIKNYH